MRIKIDCIGKHHTTGLGEASRQIARVPFFELFTLPHQFLVDFWGIPGNLLVGGMMKIISKGDRGATTTTR